VALLKHFSLLVPEDWQKRPVLDHREQEVERRSSDPVNLKIRRWIELAKVALRADSENDNA